MAAILFTPKTTGDFTNDYFSFLNQTVTDILISQLKTGNQDAFKQLVAQYQEKVFNTAISMIQDTAAAEDVTQEVFVTIFRSILGFNESSSLSTWVYRITVNKCIDYIRAKKRQRKAGIFNMIFQSDSAGPSYNKPDFEHPGVKLEQRENARYLFEAIESLPHNQKTVFVLAHIEYLPQKDIADIMNISVKAVESLLQRAKINLRKKLSAVYEGKIINERLKNRDGK